MNASVAPTQSTPQQVRRAPPWFWVASGFGVLWNAYGVFQFFSAVTTTRENLIAMGMTELQAQTMSSYPLWMTAAFAVGTLGGLVGSVLLLLRRRQAVPVFIASLAGYVVLYIGDITEGIFAVMGASQVIILSLVVVIAFGLLWTSRRADKSGILT